MKEGEDMKDERDINQIILDKIAILEQRMRVIDRLGIILLIALALLEVKLFLL